MGTFEMLFNQELFLLTAIPHWHALIAQKHICLVVLPSVYLQEIGCVHHTLDLNILQSLFHNIQWCVGMWSVIAGTTEPHTVHLAEVNMCFACVCINSFKLSLIPFLFSFLFTFNSTLFPLPVHNLNVFHFQYQSLTDPWHLLMFYLFFLY